MLGNKVLVSGLMRAGLGKAMSISIGFLSGIILARISGIENYGIFSWAWTFIVMGAVVSRMGLDVEIARTMPQAKAVGDLGEWLGVQRFSGRSVLIMGTIVGFVICLIINIGGLAIQGANWRHLFLIALCVPLLSLMVIRQAGLKAERRVFSMEAVQFGPWLILIPILLLASIATDSTLSAAGLLFAQCACVSLGCLCAGAMASQSWKRTARGVMPKGSSFGWIIIAAPLMFMQFFGIVQKSTDIIMLGGQVSPDQLGAYSAAVRISGLAAIGLMVVNMVLPSMAGELWAKGQKLELQRLVKTIALINLVATSVAVSFGIIFRTELLALFGEGFGFGGEALLLLLVAQMLNALAGSAGWILVTAGKRREMSLVLMTSAAVNITMNYLLIPHFGISGAAFATVVTMAVWNGLMIVLVRRFTGIKVSALGL